MTHLTRSLLAGLFAAFAACTSSAVTLLNVIDEQCPIVLSVQDMPSLVKNWNQSPWSKTWNDDQVKKFLAPLRARMKIDHWDESCKAETGYTVSELLGMAQGQVLFALTSMDLPFDDPNPEPSQFPLLIAIELGSNAPKVAKIIADNDEKEHATVKTEDFAGVKLHIYQKSAEQSGDAFVWAMVDGVWLLGPSKATIQKTVDNIQKGRVQSPLGESERYLSIKKQDPAANLLFLANIQAMYPSLKTLAEKKAAQSGSQPAGLSPTALLEAFGLGTLRDLYLTVDIGEQATNLSMGLTYSELKGLFKIIAYRDGPVAQPSFVSDKWITVGTMNFSLQDAYAGLKDFAVALNPAFGGMLQMQIKNLNQQLGVDLERDLIGSLGGTVVVASATRPGADADTPAPLAELDQIYAISLVNAPAFNKAVDALKGMMGPQADKLFTKREYLGQAIYTYAGPNQRPGQKGVSYAITPRYLFVAIGSASPIETALQGLEGKQPTLWQKPEVKAALGEIPANASAFQFQNTRAMVGGMIETLVQVAPMLGRQGKPAAPEEDGSEESHDENASDNQAPFDLSAKPDAAVIGKYWSIATGYVLSDGHRLYFHSKIDHAK